MILIPVSRTKSGKYFIQTLFLFAVFVGILLVREYVLEGYFIPTPSMEPTFMGDPKSGDKVVVDKIRFVWEDPSRWMIAVFSRKDKPGAYIKRIVGLPGDELTIVNGDILNHYEILTKPREMLADLLIPVYEAKKSFRGFSAEWRIENGSRILNEKGLELFPDEDGEMIIQTRRDVTDGYLDKWGVLRRGTNPVGDLEVSLAFQASADLEAVEIRIQDGWDTITVCLGSKGPSEISFPTGEPVALRGVQLMKIGFQSLTVSNIDDRFLLTVDGKDKLVHDYFSNNSIRSKMPEDRNNRVEIVFRGGGVILSDLSLRRDLYYTRSRRHAAPGRPAVVREDTYFLLGDNSGNSSDSRDWGLIPRNRLIGTPLMILWPLDRISLF